MTKHGKCLIFWEFSKCAQPYFDRRAECSRAQRFGTVPNSARIWHEVSSPSHREEVDFGQSWVFAAAFSVQHTGLCGGGVGTVLALFSEMRQMLQERTIWL